MRPRLVDIVVVAIVLTGVIGAPIFLPRDASPAPPDDQDDPLPDDGPTSATSTDGELASFDGTRIVFTVHRPAGSSPSKPVPLVFLGHGVTVNRSQPVTMGLVDSLVDAGFGVIVPDFRGHGQSGGTSRLSDPDQDVRDVAAVLDWAHDNLDWIVKQATDRPKDLLVGAWGYSLGGAMAHLSAALDGRIDALAPQNTMNDYVAIIAPSGAVKSLFVNVFILAGSAPSVSSEVGSWRPDPQFATLYTELMTTNRVPDAGYDLFKRLGPYTYLDRIAVPSLYIGGMPDMAFPMNEPLRSHSTLHARGLESYVFTWMGGHHVPFQAPEAGSPCGEVNDLVVDWFDHTLRGAPFEHARFQVAMDDGSCLRLADLPTARTPYDLGPIALPEMVGSLLVPVATVSATTRIVGPPVFTATSANVAGIDDILYASLVVITAQGALRIVDDQVAPMRLAGPGDRPVFLEMNGVGTVLGPGDRLLLKLDRMNEWFQTNSGRTPGAIVLQGAKLELPLVT